MESERKVVHGIIDYVNRYGEDSFQERPFNDVDSLVLCQFSYLKLDGLVPGTGGLKRAVSIEQLRERPSFEKLFYEEWFGKENRALFTAMYRSRRFRHTRLYAHVNILREEWEAQFAAVTFLLEDGTTYIAYRGTDESMVGWKEDFNMTFCSPVPSQVCAAEYLDLVAGALTGRLFVGGHSKGGNLAVYAAMNCKPQIQERLLKIYSMDGPGFMPDILRQCGYDKVESKVVKILPRSSLVGMILESGTRYQVVESSAIGLAQHNAYSWKVSGRSFRYCRELKNTSCISGAVLNHWIASLKEEQKKLFADTLYRILCASQKDNLLHFQADLKNSMASVLEAAKDMDEETKKAMSEIGRALVEAAREGTKPALIRKRSKKAQ